MKRFLFYIIFGVVSLISETVLGQEKEKPKVIVLDAGHGGRDSGAIGANGLREKDVVLKIATEVLRLNKSLYNEALDIYLTRYSDTLISLNNRTRLTKILNANVFVSIHCNHAERKAAQGIEVYFKRGNHESGQLAYQFSQGFSKQLGFKNRGVKRANFQVLRETGGFCPGVLLELGFLSNREEAKQIGKQTTLSAIAMVILENLIKKGSSLI